MVNAFTPPNATQVNDTSLKPILEANDLQQKIDQEVDAEGAIHIIRDLKNVAFVIIRTLRDRFQVVLDGENLKMLEGLQEGDFIKLKGKVLPNPAAYKGIEVVPSLITKIGGPKEQLPVKLGKKKLDMNIDTKLDERVLTLRHLDERAIFKLQEGIVKAFSEYLLSQRFTEIHSPKLVEAGAEGGANIFKLDYFGKQAYLAQSPQFYKQFMVPVYGRVFEIGPVFRAEKHSTSRHVNEYTSMDCEIGYIDSFKDVMSIEVGFLKHLMHVLKEEYKHELDMLKVDLPEVNAVPSMRFEDAKNAAAQKYGRKFRDKFDMEPEEERLISRYAKEELGSEFVFVTNYPWIKRPFYTMRSQDNPEYTEGFDLLFRGLEITTGGQRIHDYDMQVQAMNDKGLNPDDFNEYLKLHKYGTPPHGGFGLGLERLTMKLLGRENIRDTVLFPRDMNRLTP